MPKRGTLGHDMMFRSTTIQVRGKASHCCMVLTGMRRRLKGFSTEPFCFAHRAAERAGVEGVG